MGLTVHEFQIKLLPSEADRRLRVELASFPERTLLCKPCEAPLGLDSLRQECLRPLLSHIDDPIEPARLEHIGRRLASVLFPSEIHSTLFGALMRSPNPGNFVLRLRLVTREANLAELPWEFAYLDACLPLLKQPGFIGLLPCTHLIRQHDATEDLAPLAIENLKVLVAWANPSSASYPPLAFARQEVKALISTLVDAPHCRRLDVREIPNATVGALKSAIEEFRPNILHFIGHGEDAGTEPAIILEDGKRHARLGCNDLATLLRYKEFRLISLSACRTAAMAHRLTQGGIPAAIAMQLPWTDAIAAQFTQTLFSALTISAPLDEALAQARQSIRYAGQDWGNPVLFLRGAGTSLVEMKPERPPENLPFPRNPSFVGREDAIEAIDALLNDSPSQPVAIVGMGGMGKTQLALEYAHSRLEEYPGGVYWIRAADERQIRDSFDALGHFFRLPDGIEDRPARVLNRLKSSPVRALIIFDNVTEQCAANWIPVGYGNHILATTRDADSVRALYRTLVLREFNESSGIDLLLMRRLNTSDAERMAASEVVKRAGALPLALALISFYADRMKLSFQECVDLLNAAPLRTLINARKRFTNHTGHDGSLFDTINLGYMRLDSIGKKVLNTACFFAPRGISPALLNEACSVPSTFRFREALADVESYCLATRDSDERYNVHELTAAYVRHRMGAKQRRTCGERVAHALLRALRTANNQMNWQAIRPDIHHCAAAADTCRKDKLWVMNYELVYETGRYREEHYEFEEAARCFESALNSAPEAYGPRSIQESRALMSLATTKMHVGDNVSAIQLGELALRMAAATLPTGCSQLAEYYNEMGHIVKKGANSDLAFKYYGAAQGACADHNSALYASIRNNLGAAFEACEMYSQAIDCYHEAMRIDISLFGSEHPKVAIRLNHTGRVLAYLQRPREALDLHERALAINIATYGMLHPDVASSLYYCGVAEQALGNLKRAEGVFRDSLEIYERFFGFRDYRTNRVNRCLEELNSLALAI